MSSDRIDTLTPVRFARQLDMVDVSKLPKVCVIGCGAIGTNVAMYLAKMGVRDWVLWDPDDVRPHNVANQLFPKDTLGKLKVTGTMRLINNYSPYPHDWLDINTIHGKFTADSEIFDSSVVVSGLDTIASRREVWKAMKNELPSLYIDARSGGETIKVYTVNPMDGADVRFYEPSLTQEEYTRILCTAQSIAYNHAMTAAIVGSIVKRYTNGSEIPRLVIADTHNLTLINIGMREVTT